MRSRINLFSIDCSAKMTSRPCLLKLPMCNRSLYLLPKVCWGARIIFMYTFLESSRASVFLLANSLLAVKPYTYRSRISIIMLSVEMLVGRGAGIPSLLLATTQFCMFNRPAPGEHLGNQATFPNILVPHDLVFQHFLSFSAAPFEEGAGVPRSD